MSDPQPAAEASVSRLRSERNLWLATVRPDGRPHLVPIWFVWWQQKLWLCTNASSAKARNLAGNPAVTVSLEDGSDPVVGEGMAVLHRRPYPDGVAAAFASKYQWDITRGDDDGSYDAVIEITVSRWLFGGEHTWGRTAPVRLRCRARRGA